MLLLFTFGEFYKTFDSIAFTLMLNYKFRIKAVISAVEATPKYIFSDNLFTVSQHLIYNAPVFGIFSRHEVIAVSIVSDVFKLPPSS